MRIFIKQNGVIEFHPDQDEVLHLNPINDINCRVTAYSEKSYDVPKSFVTANNITTNNIVDQLKRNNAENSEKIQYDMREFLRQSELDD